MRSRLRPSPKPVPLKILNVTDEFTREALASEAGRSIDASATVKVLAELVRRRGAPFYVRCDSGPAAASLGGPSLPVREGPPPRRKACRRTYLKRVVRFAGTRSLGPPARRNDGGGRQPGAYLPLR